MQNIGRFIKVEREKQNLEQKYLCEEICSNSYLSKIENLESNASFEVITLLVERLGYHYDHNKDSNFELINNKLWESFLYDFEINEVLIQSAVSLIEEKKFSIYSTDAFLLKSLLAIIEDECSTIDISEMMDLNFKDTHRQRFTILISMYQNEILGEVNTLSSYKDEIGYVTYSLAIISQKEGKYFDAIDYAKKSYNIYSLNGNIKGMINACFIESNSYSNLGNLSMHEKLSTKILMLNRYPNIKWVNIEVYYNLGSSYLVAQRYDDALKMLRKCIEMGSSESIKEDYVLEKILFLTFKTKDFTSFKHHFSEINTDISSYYFFKELKEANFNINDKNVIKELEVCYNYEKQNHHGRGMLFGSILYEVYRSNYFYPKALKLLEELSSVGTYLFFK